MKQICFHLLHIVFSCRETRAGSTVSCPLQWLLAKYLSESSNAVVCLGTWHLPEHGVLFSQGVWCKKCLHAGALPSTLLLYSNGPQQTHKSSKRAAFPFVNAYTIAKTVMLSFFFPKWRAMHHLLCLPPGRAAEKAESTHPRLPSDWTEMAIWFASWHLSWQRLPLPCSLTASLYIVVAITSFLLNRHLLQQLEQTDTAICPASSGGWVAYKYSACCWHISALIPDLRTQGISVLCTFRLVGLATYWCHNDIFTIGIQLPSDFCSALRRQAPFHIIQGKNFR